MRRLRRHFDLSVQSRVSRATSQFLRFSVHLSHTEILNLIEASEMCSINNVQRLPQLFAGGPFVRFRLNLDDDGSEVRCDKVNFCGDIPLLLPLPGQSLQEIVPEFPQVLLAAEELIGFGRALWPDDEDDTILAKLRDYALAGILMGLGPSNAKLFKIWVRTLTIVIGMDDVLDKSEGEEAGEIYNLFGAMCRTTNSMFDQAIPNGHQKLAAMSPEFEALNNDLHSIERFREKMDGGMRHECFLYCQSHVVIAELKKCGLHFSGASHSRQLLRHASGWYMGVEMLLVLRDVELPAEVRQSVTFGLVRNSISDIGMLANSLFGLPRDLRLGQEDSSIMQDVQNGRSNSLEEAINKTYAELLDALTDFKLLTQLLLTMYAYEGHKSVESYVQIVCGYVDGILLGYKFWDRYGVSDKLTLFEK